MKSYIFAFLLTNCAPCLQSNQPVETTPPLENLSGAETQAVLAINLDRGDTLCSYNIEKEMTPASVTKLFTTGAALKILGADYKFATKALYDSEKDAIVVVGGGDPTFNSKYFAGNNIEKFAKNIARQLSQSGHKQIKGGIIIDDSHIDRPYFNSSRLWEDMGNYYGSAPRSLNYNDNTFEIFLNSPAAVGELCTISKTVPKLMKMPACYVKSYSGTADSAFIYGTGESDIYVTGAIPVGRTNFKVKGALCNPELTMAKDLIACLAELGIAVTDSISYGRCSPSAMFVAEQLSPPVIDICCITNKRSNNLFADALSLETSFRKTGHSNWDCATRTLTDFCKQTTGTSNHFYDGSGLSPFTGVSAASIVELLISFKNDSCFEQFEKTLAVSGEDGTLRNFCKDNGLNGKIKGKSGSMKGVVAYAGYLQSSLNEDIVFCVVVNHSCDKASFVRNEIERLLTVLAKK